MTDLDRNSIQPEHLIGICGALGEELGFNPIWLRIALGFGIVFAPVATVLGYAAVGLVVFSGRLLFRDRRPVAPVIALPVRSPVASEPLPLAA